MNTTHVAWLRAINVGGHNKLPMAELRGLFEDLGYTHVRSYIQSGNIVFDGGVGKNLEARLGAAIFERFGLTVPVMIRTRTEIEDVVRNNPFSSAAVDDPSRVGVAFLSAVPAADGIAALSALALGDDRAKVSEREVYIHCPNGFGDTRLSFPKLEKLLKVSATGRNWRTVKRMLDMAAEQGVQAPP